MVKATKPRVHCPVCPGVSTRDEYDYRKHCTSKKHQQNLVTASSSSSSSVPVSVQSAESLLPINNNNNNVNDDDLIVHQTQQSPATDKKKTASQSSTNTTTLSTIKKKKKKKKKKTLKRRSTEDEEKFECELCNKVFIWEFELNRHVKGRGHKLQAAKGAAIALSLLQQDTETEESTSNTSNYEEEAEEEEEEEEEYMAMATTVTVEEEEEKVPTTSTSSTKLISNNNNHNNHSNNNNNNNPVNTKSDDKSLKIRNKVKVNSKIKQKKKLQEKGAAAYCNICQKSLSRVRELSRHYTTKKHLELADALVLAIKQKGSEVMDEDDREVEREVELESKGELEQEQVDEEEEDSDSDSGDDEDDESTMMLPIDDDDDEVDDEEVEEGEVVGGEDDDDDYRADNVNNGNDDDEPPPPSLPLMTIVSTTVSSTTTNSINSSFYCHICALHLSSARGLARHVKRSKAHARLLDAALQSSSSPTTPPVLSPNDSPNNNNNNQEEEEANEEEQQQQSPALESLHQHEEQELSNTQSQSDAEEEEDGQEVQIEAEGDCSAITNEQEEDLHQEQPEQGQGQEEVEEEITNGLIIDRVKHEPLVDDDDDDATTNEPQPQTEQEQDQNQDNQKVTEPAEDSLSISAIPPPPPPIIKMKGRFYYCETCKACFDQLQRLLVHYDSPRHISKLAESQIINNTSNQDNNNDTCSTNASPEESEILGTESNNPPPASPAAAIVINPSQEEQEEEEEEGEEEQQQQQPIDEHVDELLMSSQEEEPPLKVQYELMPVQVEQQEEKKVRIKKKEKKDRVHYCQDCNKFFLTSSHLRRHLTTKIHIMNHVAVKSATKLEEANSSSNQSSSSSTNNDQVMMGDDVEVGEEEGELSMHELQEPYDDQIQQILEDGAKNMQLEEVEGNLQLHQGNTDEGMMIIVDQGSSSSKGEESEYTKDQEIPKLFLVDDEEVIEVNKKDESAAERDKIQVMNDDDKCKSNDDVETTAAQQQDQGVDQDEMVNDNDGNQNEEENQEIPIINHHDHDHSTPISKRLKIKSLKRQPKHPCTVCGTAYGTAYDLNRHKTTKIHKTNLTSIRASNNNNNNNSNSNSMVAAAAESSLTTPSPSKSKSKSKSKNSQSIKSKSNQDISPPPPTLSPQTPLSSSLSLVPTPLSATSLSSGSTSSSSSSTPFTITTLSTARPSLDLNEDVLCPNKLYKCTPCDTFYYRRNELTKHYTSKLHLSIVARIQALRVEEVQQQVFNNNPNNESSNVPVLPESPALNEVEQNGHDQYHVKSSNNKLKSIQHKYKLKQQQRKQQYNNKLCSKRRRLVNSPAHKTHLIQAFQQRMARRRALADKVEKKKERLKLVRQNSLELIDDDDDPSFSSSLQITISNTNSELSEELSSPELRELGNSSNLIPISTSMGQVYEDIAAAHELPPSSQMEDEASCSVVDDEVVRQLSLDVQTALEIDYIHGPANDQEEEESNNNPKNDDGVDVQEEGVEVDNPADPGDKEEELDEPKEIDLESITWFKCAYCPCTFKSKLIAVSHCIDIHGKRRKSNTSVSSSSLLSSSSIVSPISSASASSSSSVLPCSGTPSTCNSKLEFDSLSSPPSINSSTVNNYDELESPPALNSSSSSSSPGLSPEKHHDSFSSGDEGDDEEDATAAAAALPAVTVPVVIEKRNIPKFIIKKVSDKRHTIIISSSSSSSSSASASPETRGRQQQQQQPQYNNVHAPCEEKSKENSTPDKNDDIIDDVQGINVISEPEPEPTPTSSPLIIEQQQHEDEIQTMSVVGKQKDLELRVNEGAGNDDDENLQEEHEQDMHVQNNNNKLIDDDNEEVNYKEETKLEFIAKRKRSRSPRKNKKTPISKKSKQQHQSPSNVAQAATVVKGFNCEICDSTFATRYHLNRHFSTKRHEENCKSLENQEIPILPMVVELSVNEQQPPTLDNNEESNNDNNNVDEDEVEANATTKDGNDQVVVSQHEIESSAETMATSATASTNEVIVVNSEGQIMIEQVKQEQQEQDDDEMNEVLSSCDDDDDADFDVKEEVEQESEQNVNSNVESEKSPEADKNLLEEEELDGVQVPDPPDESEPLPLSQEQDEQTLTQEQPINEQNCQSTSPICPIVILPEEEQGIIEKESQIQSSIIQNEVVQNADVQIIRQFSDISDVEEDDEEELLRKQDPTVVLLNKPVLFEQNQLLVPTGGKYQINNDITSGQIHSNSSGPLLQQQSSINHHHPIIENNVTVDKTYYCSNPPSEQIPNGQALNEVFQSIINENNTVQQQQAPLQHELYYHPSSFQNISNNLVQPLEQLQIPVPPIPPTTPSPSPNLQIEYIKKQLQQPHHVNNTIHNNNNGHHMSITTTSSVQTQVHLEPISDPEPDSEESDDETIEKIERELKQQIQQLQSDESEFEPENNPSRSRGPTVLKVPTIPITLQNNGQQLQTTMVPNPGYMDYMMGEQEEKDQESSDDSDHFANYENISSDEQQQNDDEDQTPIVKKPHTKMISIKKSSLTGSTRYTCNYCNYTCTESSKWRRHTHTNSHQYVLEHKDEDWSLHCRVCRVEVTNIQNLVRHKQSEAHLRKLAAKGARGGVQSSSTEESNAGGSRKEISAGSRKAQENTRCEVCKTSYTDYTHLKRHYKTKLHQIRVKYLEKRTAHKNKKSPRRSRSSSNSSDESRSRSRGSEEEEDMDAVYDNFLVKKSRISVQEPIIDNNEPSSTTASSPNAAISTFICKTCGNKSFATSRDLERHYKTELHQNREHYDTLNVSSSLEPSSSTSSSNSLRCEDCKRSFPHRYDLEVHVGTKRHLENARKHKSRSNGTSHGHGQQQQQHQHHDDDAEDSMLLNGIIDQLTNKGDEHISGNGANDDDEEDLMSLMMNLEDDHNGGFGEVTQSGSSAVAVQDSPDSPPKKTKKSSNRDTNVDGFVYCPDCNKPCRNRGALASHRIVHSTSRAFKCDDCGLDFKRDCDLKSHLKNKLHSNPELMKRMIARRKAKERADTKKLTMQNHSNGNHGSIVNNVGSSSNTMVLDCIPCNQTFSSPKALKVHLERKDHMVRSRLYNRKENLVQLHGGGGGRNGNYYYYGNNGNAQHESSNNEEEEEESLHDEDEVSGSSDDDDSSSSSSSSSASSTSTSTNSNSSSSESEEEGEEEEVEEEEEFDAEIEVNKLINGVESLDIKERI